MSGGSGGGHIIIDSIKRGLGDPLVSGNLPAKMQGQASELVAKDTGDWTASDKSLAGKIVSWALQNLT